MALDKCHGLELAAEPRIGFRPIPVKHKSENGRKVIWETFGFLLGLGWIISSLLAHPGFGQVRPGAILVLRLDNPIVFQEGFQLHAAATGIPGLIDPFAIGFHYANVRKIRPCKRTDGP
jgi:hypothetical protein